MKLFAHITEDNIPVLVDTFYSKVGKDPSLGPIFNRVIHDWPPHLNKMYDFWSSVMLHTGKYKGNPVAQHRNIMPLDRALFDRWLELFAETARELFETEPAEAFIEKSKNIARSLQYMLYDFPVEKNRPPGQTHR